MSVAETPLFIGEDHPLFAIVSEPAERKSRRTGIILLNSGLVHRAGPFRLGVEIARSLASQGFTVIRLDQSARGDSKRRKGLSVVEAANLDIELAKEALRSQTGIDKVVLAGLCSGADDIVRHVADKTDVDGLVLMDPYAPKTRQFQLRYYLPRLLNPARVFRFLLRKLGHVKKDEDVAPSHDLGSFREFPNCPQAASAFRAVSNSGGASLCLFTSGVYYYYNYVGQLVKGLSLQDISGDIEEVFFKTAEHTYPLTSHRKRLVEIIADFCDRRFA